jgi:hypothetical protein
MPEPKGRKRKRERRRGSGNPASAEAQSAQQAWIPPGGPPVPPLPSRNVRLAGFALALVTMMFGIMLVSSAIDGGGGSGNQIARGIGGVLMLALALVIGVLSVMPAAVRSWVRR